MRNYPIAVVLIPTELAIPTCAVVSFTFTNELNCDASLFLAHIIFSYLFTQKMLQFDWSLKLQ